MTLAQLKELVTIGTELTINKKRYSVREIGECAVYVVPVKLAGRDWVHHSAVSQISESFDSEGLDITKSNPRPVKSIKF